MVGVNEDSGMGVGKDSGMGVSKDLGMVGVNKDSSMGDEWVSSHFLVWQVKFQPRIAYSCWSCDVNVR